MWGTDVSYSCPAGGGRALSDLRAKGVKTISIDPRFVPDAAKADVWLPIRPGTDVALMLCWTKYIMEKDLYDHEFVMRWTNLPYLVNVKTKLLVRAADLGMGDAKTYVVWDKKTNSPKPIAYPWDDALDPALDGAFTWKGVEYKTGWRLLLERCEPWTLEKAVEVCWLDPKKIEEAIKLYVENNGGIANGVASDMTESASQVPLGCMGLDSIMGRINKPGVTMTQKGGGSSPP